MGWHSKLHASIGSMNKRSATCSRSCPVALLGSGCSRLAYSTERLL